MASTPTSGDKGLKKDGIGFSDGLTIALASTAPAYSLAAAIGSIVVIVGFQAPAALLVAFVPMFFIAAAFYMNRADQGGGTSFSRVTRAIGPRSGWIIGWADLPHRHPRRRRPRDRVAAAGKAPRGVLKSAAKKPEMADERVALPSGGRLRRQHLNARE